MKNVISIPVILLLSFLCLPVIGQDTLKTFNNKWSTELNFNPFNGNLSFNNTIGQIKFRYFQPNGNAWRFAVTLGYNQNNSSVENIYGTNPYENTNRQKSTLIGLNVGKEKHFKSTKRLSPYIGWEAGFGYKSSSQKIKNDQKTTEIKGAWVKYISTPSYEYPNGYYTTQTYEERGYWSVGANVVTGFDFYMSEKFYFGYELLFGIDYMSLKDIDITEKYSNGDTNLGSIFPDYSDESWKLGPKLVNGIRIGFIF